MLNGRINRKTFIIGNMFGLFVLGVISFLVIVPLALIDIVIKNKEADSIINSLYYIVAFPALLYLVYLSVLMIKRAHDIGLPGLLIVIGFFTAIVVSKLTGVHYFNLFSLLILFALALIPGNKTRNNFGPTPRKKFKLTELKINN